MHLGHHTVAIVSMCLVNCYSSSSYTSPDTSGTVLELNPANIAAGNRETGTIVVWLAQNNMAPLAKVKARIAVDQCAVTPSTQASDFAGRVAVTVQCSSPGQHGVSAVLELGDTFVPLPSTASINAYPEAVYGGLAPGYALNVAATLHTADGMIDHVSRPALQVVSSDPLAQLPSPYILKGTDRGNHFWLNGIKLFTPGVQTVQVMRTDTHAVVSSETHTVGYETASILHISNVPATVQAGVYFSPTITVVGASGGAALAPDCTLNWSSSDTGAVLPPANKLASNVGSQASHPLSFAKAGQQVLSVQCGQLAGASVAVNVQPGNAAYLTLDGPSSIRAGDAILLNLAAYDKFNNLVTFFNDDLVITSSDPQAVMPSPITVSPQDAGREAVAAVVRTAGLQTLQIADLSDPTVIPAVLPVTVTPGLATHLSLALPKTAQAGVPTLGQLSALDYFGNTASAFAGTVQMSSANANAAFMPATINFTSNDAGIKNVSITPLLIGIQNFSASAVGMDNIGNAYTVMSVTAGPASALQITSLVHDVAQKKPFQVRVASFDSYGNPQPNCNCKIHLSSSDTAATLPADHPLDSSGNELIDVTLKTLQTQNISVSDSLGNINGSTATFRVIKVTALAHMSASTSQSACAILSTGELKCWGQNSSGQLGLGDYLDRGYNLSSLGVNLPAVAVPSGRNVVQAALGQESTCAVLDNQQLICWGNDAHLQGYYDGLERGGHPGQMGNALPIISFDSATTVKHITLGNNQSCAILSDDTLQCWGFFTPYLGNAGTSGDYWTNSRPVINLGSGRKVKTMQLSTAPSVYSQAVGGQMICALLDDNSVKCWGYNWGGMLGTDTSDDRGDVDAGDAMGDTLPPINLGTGRTAVAVAAGSSTTCVVDDLSAVRCWGAQYFGEQGNGDGRWRGRDGNTMGDFLPSVALGIGRTAKTVGIGAFHACALLDNAMVKCWGHGPALGLGDTIDRGSTQASMGDNLPYVNLGTGRTAVQLEVAAESTCVLLDDATVKCWGKNDHGQLGVGDQNPRGAAPNQMGDALPPVPLW